ncbi:WW domain-binding protein 4-like [Liolophura sinensis]|uniref:WW domain-binding protein 4-like n=1 Tax=Liolophura sinensis TaxID=3198878 RepID=UPI003159543C
MATYWKSQPRKFCDYCKCWITDNKPSVDFHEKGKKHQENVKRRIDEIKQKSLKDAAEKNELDSDMRKLEEAAIAAFKKDLINNPELAAQYGVKIKADTEEKETEESESPVVYGPSLPEPCEPPDTEEWYEAKSDEGYTYYWSTKTGASVWEKPEQYTSLDGAVVKTSEEICEPDPALPPDVDSIPLPGEPVGDLGYSPKPEDIPLPSECTPAVVERVVYTQDKPDTSRAAYGQWASVVQEPIPDQIDLQLPTQPVENIPLPPPSFSSEEIKIKFKEKKVTSLGGDSEGSVTFKKRKIMNKSRNTRKREDDDND